MGAVMGGSPNLLEQARLYPVRCMGQAPRGSVNLSATGLTPPL